MAWAIPVSCYHSRAFSRLSAYQLGAEVENPGGPLQQPGRKPARTSALLQPAIGASFHLERRCTMILFTEFIRATAFGSESIAFFTIGSVSTAIRRASSTPNAVMYISRLRKRWIHSLLALKS